MNKVVNLVPREGKLKPEIIEALNELLSMAQKGELSGIAVAYTQGDGGAGSVAIYENHHLMVGTTTVMQHDLLHFGDVPGTD